MNTENQSKIRVLLIEDITGDAHAITRAISYGDIDQFYNFTRATRLNEGIDLLKQNNFDVILLDLSLPDAKDIKSVVEIKVLFPDVPIIVLSDQSDERVIQRALLNGASKFLPKSEASGVLIRKIIEKAIADKKVKSAVDA
jgi:DNA-binding NarL/FixJ family response regulator